MKEGCSESVSPLLLFQGTIKYINKGLSKQFELKFIPNYIERVCPKNIKGRILADKLQSISSG